MIKYTLFIMYIASITFSLNSNNLIVVWFLLELNIILFIPLHSKQNINTLNSLIKYFIVQRLARLILLILILVQNFLILSNYTNQIISLVLILKIGIFPFSSWYFQVTENIEWFIWFLINTLQKIIPIWLVSNYCNIFLINTMVVINRIYRSIEMWKQNSIRWLLNRSSLNHIRWILISLNTNRGVWEIYLIIYCYLSYNMYKILNNSRTKTILRCFNLSFSTKIVLAITVLNFIGVPPIIGFMPKLLVIVNLNSIIVLLPLIVNNTLLIFFYITLIKNLITKNNYNKIKPTFLSYYLPNRALTASFIFYFIISF